MKKKVVDALVVTVCATIAIGLFIRAVWKGR